MLYHPLPKDLERQYQEHFGPPSIKHPNHKAMRNWIMERSRGICECPGGERNGGEPGSPPCQSRIEHIHHLVYPHLAGQERAWMLVGLCKRCHETIHGKNSVLDTAPCCKYRYDQKKRHVYPVIFVDSPA